MHKTLYTDSSQHNFNRNKFSGLLYVWGPDQAQHSERVRSKSFVNIKNFR